MSGTASAIQPQNAYPQRRDGFIDIARGLAILLVVGVHQGQSVSGMSPLLDFVADLGQFGVQLFFVASAYTLCQSAMSRESEYNWIGKFYVRRWFRIAPLYFLGIGLYALISFLRARLTGDGTAWSAYSPFAVVSNILLVHGFVPEANNNIVPGGWSIGTEVAFYALFPAIWMALRKSGGATPIRSAVVLLLLAILMNASLQLAVFQFSGHYITNNSFLYYNLLNQGPVFAAGIIAFSIRDTRLGRSIIPLLSVFSIFFVIGIFMVLMQIEWLYAVIPAVFGVAFGAFILLLRAKNASSSVLQLVGVRSYSMYIFHFVFAWYASRAFVGKFGVLPAVGADGTFAVLLLVSVLATLGVAWLTERLVERRAISLGSSVIRRMPSSSPVRRGQNA